MRDRSAGLLAWRRVVRQPQPPQPCQLRILRPSVMDLRFRGDACVLDGEDGTLELCLGNFSLAQVAGLPFDLPHLNTLVDRLRHSRRSRPC